MLFRVALFVLAAAALAGCSTSSDCSASVASTCPSVAPSYAEDVQPILATYCTSCHAAGGEQADKPLTSYAHVKALASDIEGEVGSCDMPPSDESQPTDAQRTVLLNWIVCGASND